MGLLKVAGDVLGLDGGKSLSRAQRRAAQMGEQRLGALSDRYDPLAAQLDPSLSYLAEGATPMGYAGQLEDIQTSGLFDLLNDTYQTDVQYQLASQGLSRWGYGADLSGKTGMQTLMQLGDLFQGRQGEQFNIGKYGLDTQSGLEQQAINLATSGIIGPAQTEQNAQTGMMNLFGGLGGAAIGGLLGNPSLFG